MRGLHHVRIYIGSVTAISTPILGLSMAYTAQSDSGGNSVAVYSPWVGCHAVRVPLFGVPAAGTSVLHGAGAAQLGWLGLSTDALSSLSTES